MAYWVHLGDRLEILDVSAEASWLDASCDGEGAATVASLLPDGFDSYVMVEAPAPDIEDWWSAYRQLFSVIVHTLTAKGSSCGWLAFWDGHEIAASIPRAGLMIHPYRDYKVVSGALQSVAGISGPPYGLWTNPDLVWPDDRKWFVATDVDFWSLFVGGSTEQMAELRARLGQDVEPVSRDHPLPIEP